jgi:hypothetical protein
LYKKCIKKIVPLYFYIIQRYNGNIGQPNTTTNAQGEYLFIVPTPISVTLTPSLSGYTFTPSNRPLSNITTDQLNQDFVAKTVGIDELKMGNGQLKIYPNPAFTQLYVKYFSQETVNYTIYSVVGQIIQQGKLQEDSSINIESLASGLYYLKVLNKTMKFVKE